MISKLVRTVSKFLLAKKFLLIIGFLFLIVNVSFVSAVICDGLDKAWDQPCSYTYHCTADGMSRERAWCNCGPLGVECWCPIWRAFPARWSTVEDCSTKPTVCPSPVWDDVCDDFDMVDCTNYMSCRTGGTSCNSYISSQPRTRDTDYIRYGTYTPPTATESGPLGCCQDGDKWGWMGCTDCYPGGDHLYRDCRDNYRGTLSCGNPECTEYYDCEIPHINCVSPQVCHRTTDRCCTRTRLNCDDGYVYNCGNPSDGCGNTYNCGACAGDQRCYDDGSSWDCCDIKYCDEWAPIKECGTWYDDCGQNINCGVGGTPNCAINNEVCNGGTCDCPGCKIGGAAGPCYNQNDPDPGEVCQFCDTGTSRTTWTPRAPDFAYSTSICVGDVCSADNLTFTDYPDTCDNLCDGSGLPAPLCDCDDFVTNVSCTANGCCASSCDIAAGGCYTYGVNDCPDICGLYTLEISGYCAGCGPNGATGSCAHTPLVCDPSLNGQIRYCDGTPYYCVYDTEWHWTDEPIIVEVCDDLVDNDGDTWIDCNDTVDCSSDPYCTQNCTVDSDCNPSFYCNGDSGYCEYTCIYDKGSCFFCYDDCAAYVNDGNPVTLPNSTAYCPEYGWYENPICTGIEIPSDLFIVKTNTNDTVAAFTDTGDIYLQGSCSGGSCDDISDNAFFVKDDLGNTVSYIDSSGNMCSVESAPCRDQWSNCNNPPDGSFIIKNRDGTIMSYIGPGGELCLIGTLYQNSNP